MGLQLKHITQNDADLETARHLFKEYSNELAVDLCFQSFEEELANPLKKYGPPTGSLILAFWDDKPVGTVALQALEEEGVCEMKRLYVQAEYRKFGIGEALVIAILADAKQLGYTKMKLDTLERLKSALPFIMWMRITMKAILFFKPNAALNLRTLHLV